MELQLKIELPMLWGDTSFERNTWGAINYCVGPNGTGKSLFADQLKAQLAAKQLKPRLISADRLMGLERHEDYWGRRRRPGEGLDIGQFQQTKREAEQKGLISDSFILIREKLDIRIRIEAFLSTLFARRIRLVEQGGFLVPKIINVANGAEYDFRKQECHGLKELISLLAYVYDDETDCLLIDEPELHLHPQFQSFFLTELLRVAGDPRENSSKKLVFLFTHSPYFLDIRSVEDLENCLVFQNSQPPASVGQLEDWEKTLIRRLLPRLNTHHKQFFFSGQPVFVEGYTDSQLFTAIEDARGIPLGANGATFIDVGGISEQELFLRLATKLGVKAKVIADLDALFDGQLRNAIGEHPGCQSFVTENGLGAAFSDAINSLTGHLDTINTALQGSDEAELRELKEAVTHAEAPRRRYRTLIACLRASGLIKEKLPAISNQIDGAEGVLKRIREAAGAAGAQILPLGALENHLSSYTGCPYHIERSAKALVLAEELEFIANRPTRDQLNARYGDLIAALDAVVSGREVNSEEFVSYSLGDWIAAVQRGFDRGEIHTAEELQGHPDCQWDRYSRILELRSFEVTTDPDGFTCVAVLNTKVDPLEREIRFDDNTLPAKYRIPEAPAV